MKVEERNEFLNLVGKLDDYVVYKRRGQTCLRRRPAPPRGIPSAGFAAQQERIAAIAIFYRALKEAGLYPYWQRAAKGLVAHGYNLITKANLPAFGGQGKIGDFTKLRLTPNLLPLPDGLTLAAEADGTRTLEWLPDTGLPGAAADDEARLLVMPDDETFVLANVDAGGATRGDGTLRLALPDERRDYPHLFVHFRSRTGGVCSVSRYFNLI